jgi:hypothetical protein
MCVPFNPNPSSGPLDTERLVVGNRYAMSTSSTAGPHSYAYNAPTQICPDAFATTLLTWRPEIEPDIVSCSKS